MRVARDNRFKEVTVRGSASANRTGIVSAFVAVFAVTLACCPSVNLPTGLGGGAKCVVPNLIGQSEDAARQSLSDLELNPVETNQYSEGFEPGTIIRTDPPAGTELDPCEGDVVIVVSLGAAREEPTPPPAATEPAPAEPPTPEVAPAATLRPLDLPPMGIRVYDEVFDYGFVEAFRPEWNVDAVPEAAFASQSGNLVTEQYVLAWIGDETWVDYGLKFGRADFEDVTQFSAMIRVQDPQNFIGIDCFKSEGRLLCEGHRTIDGQSMGVPNFMQQATAMYVDGQVEGSNIELRAVGNEFTVLRNAEVVGRMTDDTFPTGSAGFMVDGRLVVDYIHAYEPVKPASGGWTYVRDDFSRNQWPTGETQNEIAWVSRELLSDAYRMQVRALVDDVVMAYETLLVPVEFNPGGFPYEFTASVSASKISGPESTGMGLLFGCRDEVHCFEFSVLPDAGSAWLYQIEEGQRIKLEGPVQIGSVPQYDSVLTVIGSDGTYSFLVNDQPAFTTQLESADWQRIGLSVQVGGQDYVGVVTFDDVVIKEPFEGTDGG